MTSFLANLALHLLSNPAVQILIVNAAAAGIVLILHKSARAELLVANGLPLAVQAFQAFDAAHPGKVEDAIAQGLVALEAYLDAHGIPMSKATEDKAKAVFEALTVQAKAS